VSKDIVVADKDGIAEQSSNRAIEITAQTKAISETNISNRYSTLPLVQLRSSKAGNAKNEVNHQKDTRSEIKRPRLSTGVRLNPCELKSILAIIFSNKATSLVENKTTSTKYH